MELQFTLKHCPEDFRVDEIAQVELKKSGPFAVYILSKKNRTTVEALKRLIADLDLGGLGDFSFGGKKDRQAITTQYVAYQGKRFPDQKGDGYEAVFIGFMDRPMGPDLVTGNRHILKVRNLSQVAADKAIAAASPVEEFGFENYFDDQRFANYDPDHGWFAERLLKEQFNGALKTHLCSVLAEDNEETVARKEAIFKNWRNWEAFKKIARTKFEVQCAYTLARKPDAYLDLLRKLPRDDVAFYFTAYQAYFWNEVVRRLLAGDAEIGCRRFKYPGRAGDYLFYDRSAERSEWLCATHLPTLSSVLPKEVSDPLFWDIYRRLLTECGLKRAKFNDLKIRQYRFESRMRPILVKPREVKTTVHADEFFVGKACLELRFNLPRASYAPMFVKRLLADEMRSPRRAPQGPRRRD